MNYRKNSNQTAQQSKKQKAQPLYIKQVGDTAISVLPTFLQNGAVLVKIQRKDGENVRKLQAKVKIHRFQNIDFSAPQGTVICEAMDGIPPATCAELGYRNDGLGYLRTFLCTISNAKTVECRIDCTVCEQDQNKHLVSVGDYVHTEKITLPLQNVRDMACVIALAYDAELERQAQREKAPQKSTSRALDIDYDG